MNVHWDKISWKIKIFVNDEDVNETWYVVAPGVLRPNCQWLAEEYSDGGSGSTPPPPPPPGHSFSLAAFRDANNQK